MAHGRFTAFSVQEPGWYRKKFDLPAEFRAADARITLRFDGVFHITTAWLDGAATSSNVILDNPCTASRALHGALCFVTVLIGC